MDRKYAKLPIEIQQLAEKRDLLKENSASADEIKKANLEILETLKKHFPTSYNNGEKSFQLYGTSVPSKHGEIDQLRKEQSKKIVELRETGVLEDVKNLRDETRKLEIMDTSLIGYLQLLFVDDSQDYHVWKRESVQPGGVPQFLEEQADMIDTIPFNLGQLSDNQLIDLFSLLTSHIWCESDENRNPTNKRIYRNQAVYYVKELKEVLKTLKPIYINTQELSYKIAQVTKGPGKGKIIEFRYSPFFNEEGKHDRGVYVIIHDSWAECKQNLQKTIQDIYEKKSKLQSLLAEKRFFFDSNFHHYDKSRWEKQRDILEGELINIYEGSYIQEAQSRLQKTRENRGYMSAYTYLISTKGMLDLIQKAIDELDAVGNRLQQYVYAKK